jgi:hypothetical protein
MPEQHPQATPGQLAGADEGEGDLVEPLEVGLDRFPVPLEELPEAGDSPTMSSPKCFP